MLLEIKTKVIKFCTKFQVKKPNSCHLNVAANQDSKVVYIFSKKFKTQCALY